MTASSRVDHNLSPFVGSRDDFAAYLHDLEPVERETFIATLPAAPAELARSLFPLNSASAHPSTPPLAIPEGGWRFRVRNGTGGEMLYLNSYQRNVEHARNECADIAAQRWKRFGISVLATRLTVTLVDERGRRLES